MNYKSDTLGVSFYALENEYRDSLGRYCYQHKSKSDWTEENYDSLNQFLWTGEALLLIDLCAVKDEGYRLKKIQLRSDVTRMLRALTNETRGPLKENAGLYSRQPNPYKYKKQFDPISIDEYFGLMSTFLVTELEDKANECLEYAKKVSFFISDWPAHHGVNPLRYFKMWKTYKDIFKITWYSIKKRDLTGSNELDKIIYESPSLRNLTRWFMPKDQLWFCLACNKKPSWIMITHTQLAAKSTLKIENNETSGRCLLFFKILFLQKYLEKKEDKKISEMQKKLASMFHEKSTEKYGEHYLPAIFSKYYEDSLHPFHAIAKEIKFSNTQEKYIV